MGLDTFHLDGTHEYAGNICDSAHQLALVPTDDVEKVGGLLFDIQWAADVLRRRHIRPFTLRYNEMLLQVEAKPDGLPVSSLSETAPADVADFWQAIEDRLRLLAWRVGPGIGRYKL